jgi:hypothetical protein
MKRRNRDNKKSEEPFETEGEFGTKATKINFS